MNNEEEWKKVSSRVEESEGEKEGRGREEERERGAKLTQTILLGARLNPRPALM